MGDFKRKIKGESKGDSNRKSKRKSKGDSMLQERLQGYSKFSKEDFKGVIQG